MDGRSIIFEPESDEFTKSQLITLATQFDGMAVYATVNSSERVGSITKASCAFGEDQHIEVRATVDESAVPTPREKTLAPAIIYTEEGGYAVRRVFLVDSSNNISVAGKTIWTN